MGQKIAIKLPCLTELDWQEGNKKREDCKFVFIQAETLGLFPSLFCRPNGCKFFNKEYVMFAFLKPDFEYEWNETCLKLWKKQAKDHQTKGLLCFVCMYDLK